MIAFFLSRGVWLAAVVAIMFAISLAQGAISYTMAFGPLSGFLPNDRSAIATVLVVLRFGLVALMAALWATRRKRALFRVIIVANAVNALLLDVVLMATSNILIFSVWYWIVDPPGVGEVPRADEAWDFLFPQRAGTIPNYESWVPRYGDYLFVAFTASFCFGPADAPPLSRRAKAIMLLQAVISVTTLTAIAGSAINILAGAK